MDNAAADEEARAGRLSKFLQNRRFAIAAPHIRGRVLDFGSHHGTLTAMCRPEAYLGVERDPDFLAIARRLHPDYEFVTTLPASGAFDTVVALAVIEHVKDPTQVLQDLAAVLAPDGRILLTTPHPRLEWLHTVGAKVRLFSQAAHDEHEDLLDRATMAQAARPAGLTLEKYKRFLLGANQFFVLRRM